MSGILRWSPFAPPATDDATYLDGMWLNPDGHFVMYGDHEAAIRACEQRVTAPSHYWDLGYAAGVQAARDAVVAAFGPPRLHPNWQECGDRDHSCYLIADALAAIDGLKGEQA